LFIAVQNDFSVALRLENVTTLFQLFTQLNEIVNLAIEHDLQSFVLIGHRLSAGVEVNDTQPPVPHAYRTLHVGSMPIGTAMAKCSAHLVQQIAVNWSRLEIKNATNAAHLA
jgi:hypothetical protein